MMYLIGLSICLALGFLTLRAVSKQNTFTGPLLWCLSLSLGLGCCGLITFITHLVLGLHQPWVPALSSLVLGGILYYQQRHQTFIEPINWQTYAPGLITLGLLGLFLLPEALRYPLGGWDAWSCWNLKAKFIYLGRENWKEMLEPLLWRSNTHYPLLLPCINVFFFDLQGYANWIPMLNSLLFTCCGAGLLLFGLYQAFKSWLIPIALTAAGFFIPFHITINISQYSDICLGLYLMLVVVAFIADELILAAIALGLLAFTKTEGSVAALILSVGICFLQSKRLKEFLPWLIVFLLPTIIFTGLMAPRNEAFINGFLSATKPSTWQRLQIIGVMSWYEMISPKWNGIWLLVLGVLIASWKKAFKGKLLLFTLFTVGYIGILMAYYQVNTFFEISWWISNTFSRIIAAILPALLYWVGLALL